MVTRTGNAQQTRLVYLRSCGLDWIGWLDWLDWLDWIGHSWHMGKGWPITATH
jgi:hypothetical protein